jgi:ABC-type multidrug transport system fused ATPase/permease subunit
LLNDINSVRSIYVLRQGAEPARLESADAIFVTTNSAFARAAYEFGKNHNSTKEVSSVITDYSLANVAWLKAPMKRPSLPEKETLALCYAALEPGSELFRKYVEMMSQLTATGQISEEEHAILRLSPIAHQELMHFTLGDEEALTGAGLHKILDRAKERLVAEQKRLADEERKQLEDQHLTVLRGQQERERELKTELDHQSEAYRTSAEEHAKVLLRVSGRARSFSKAVTILIMLVFSAVLLVGAAAGSGLLSTGNVVSKILKILIWGSVIVAVGWGWLSWITGSTLRSLTAYIESLITLKFFSWFTGRRSLPKQSNGTDLA